MRSKTGKRNDPGVVTVKDIIRQKDQEIMQGLDEQDKKRQYHSSLSKYEDPALFKIFGRIQDKLTTETALTPISPTQQSAMSSKSKLRHTRVSTIATADTPHMHDVSFINLREQFNNSSIIRVGSSTVERKEDGTILQKHTTHSVVATPPAGDYDELDGASRLSKKMRQTPKLQFKKHSMSISTKSK